MEHNRRRLEKLLQRRRRSDRFAALAAAWLALGISISPLSADRQDTLISQMRAAGFRRSGPLSVQDGAILSREIMAFTEQFDMLICMGWDIDEDPAVLLPKKALCRSVPYLRTIYPDGFVLIDQPAQSALAIDFDEDDLSVIHVERVSLATEL